MAHSFPTRRSSDLPTYHVADPDGLRSPTEIRHRAVHEKTERITRDWLPRAGAINVGLTSGASTPDNLVEAVVRTLERFTSV